MSKKSFLLYTDSLDILEHLSDEQSGKLFKAIRLYSQGNNPDLDPLLTIAFIPIRNQIDRDIDKYNRICERNKVNGSKGGRPRKPKKPSGLYGNPKNPSEPKKAHTDNDTDTDTDNDTDNDTSKTPCAVTATFNAFWSQYPKKKDRKKSLEIWKLKKLYNGKCEAVMNGLDRALASYDWRKDGGKFIPLPTTWLNGERWDDEYDTTEPHRIQRSGFDKNDYSGVF